jgi:hypothetical protein
MGDLTDKCFTNATIQLIGCYTMSIFDIETRIKLDYCNAHCPTVTILHEIAFEVVLLLVGQMKINRAQFKREKLITDSEPSYQRILWAVCGCSFIENRHRRIVFVDFNRDT